MITPGRSTDAATYPRNEKARWWQTQRAQIVSQFCTTGLQLTRLAGGQLKDDCYGIGTTARRPQLSRF